MTVTEVRQALGSWEIRLKDSCPRSLYEQLNYFGHIVIVPGELNVADYGDQLLSVARYVGVLQANSAGSTRTIGGVGMAYWLGDSDGKGDVFETPVELVDETFANSVNAVLPPGGALIPGTIYSVPGLFSGRFVYVNPRKALDYVTSTYGAEWRVNGDGTVDAGLADDLFDGPTCILHRKSAGQDLRFKALTGGMDMDLDVEDYTTRVVLLAEGEGDAIATGDADGPATPFLDIHGNPVVITRLVSESATSAGNADVRAQLALSQFEGQRAQVQLSTQEYDIKGNLAVGDWLYVYDPDSGFSDTANEAVWEGERIAPLLTRCYEMQWPIRPGWTVAFRTAAGTWLDLSEHYAAETGQTTIGIGELPRSLVGLSSEPVGTRPNPADTTTPNAPAFTDFSVGAYQSVQTSTTKAAIRATWTIPLNLDGSTVTDGDHYEIRYRISQVIGYQVLWGALTTYRWGSLSGNRWGAPISEAIEASPEWLTAFVPWGTNAWTLLELTPGVVYELQIRAVDAQAPPHQGPYSSSSFVTAIGDLFAPSTPAPPTVAGNMVSIQVTHTLGKASGGTYNLEPDLDHLEVHVGGSAAFYADDGSMVGKLAANAANMGGEIPAVGSFTIRQTDQVYIKVRAVDRSGNKSGASVAAQVTAVLIDNAHISDLSVSKLTAGTITANMILAAALNIGTAGIVQLTEGSVRVQDNLGRQILEIGKRTLDPQGGYGLSVFDSSGNVRIRMGESAASEGGYGLEVANVFGTLVAMSTLAFGPTTAAISSGETTTSSSYTDLATVGPTAANVVIGNAGRCLVIVSALVDSEAVAGSAIKTGGGYMSFQVDGPSPLSAQDGQAAAYRFIYDKTGTVEDTSYELELGVSKLSMLTGLVAGTYTFTAKYRSASGGVSTEFGDRSIVVLPY